MRESNGRPFNALCRVSTATRGPVILKDTTCFRTFFAHCASNPCFAILVRHDDSAASHGERLPTCAALGRGPLALGIRVRVAPDELRHARAER